MSKPDATPDPRRGALGKFTGVVYWLIVVELAFLLASAPGFLGTLFLAQEPSNLPLFALCLVPMGPAFSAALSALRARERDGDLVVWPRYWRSWLANVREMLFLWVPALVALTILGMNVAFGAAAGVSGVLVIISLVIGVVVALWTLNAVLIASLYSFRLRDIARLALYYLAAKPLVTLGSLSLLVIIAVVVTFASGWVLALLASVLAALMLANTRTMRRDIEARFIAPDAGAAAST